MESTCATATTTTSPTIEPTFPAGGPVRVDGAAPTGPSAPTGTGPSDGTGTTTGPSASSAARTGMTADEFDAAFTALMPRLRRRLLALTGNPHDADDLLQETYLRLSRRARARTLARQQQPYAYTCATALNVLRDHWRHSARRERCTDRLPEPSWDGGFARKEAEAVATALLRALSPKEAAAVILVDLEGLTHDMAGERLGAHRGTVQRNRMRGLAKIRAAVGAYEGGPAVVSPTPAGRSGRPRSER
ncbi:RNA polymerase sigma factor [Streptomyces longwoodensis]|uniref:RNA polymerase sigma factor n=1 Tax=Streptomyces longwoodensis TaxID=68231 RepID=UPI003F4D2F5A